MRRLLGLLIGLSLLFISGCSYKYGSDLTHVEVKTFPQEDIYIFNALELQKVGDYNRSAILYQELYNKSHKEEYLLERFKILYHLKAYDLLLKELNIYLDQAATDKDLLRFKIAVLSSQDKTEEAKEVAFVLLNVTKEPQDYQRVASLYLRQNNYESALKYLESAYAVNNDEDMLSDLSTIMYLKLGRKKEAISYLESHIRIHGISIKIGEKLVSFYSDQDDVAGQITTYQSLFDLTENPVYAQKIIQIYAYKRDNTNLAKFLEKSGFNDELLLRVYMAQKNYAKSIGLAKKLFEQSQDPYFEAQYAIALYESTPKPSKKVLKQVIKALKHSVKLNPDATFLNYLGYVLIDHEYNIKQGIYYVNEALKLEKDSGFFLDSLAWGYYKLKQCKKALKLIKKAKKVLDQSYPEVEEHYKLIKKCKR